MKYKKEGIKNHKVLGMYPVYVNSVYGGREPLKIVGIREDQIELQGDYSGIGADNSAQWFRDQEAFVLREVCEESLKTNGCQVPNVHCCGGGSVVRKHSGANLDSVIETDD